MARLNMAADLGAPLTVVAADLISEKVRPEWNEWVAYITCGIGYVMGVMGVGGDYAKNIGVASLPWAAKHIAKRAGFTPGMARAVSSARVSRYPGLAQPGFATARLA